MTTSFKDFFILNLHHEFSRAKEFLKAFVYSYYFCFTVIY